MAHNGSLTNLRDERRPRPLASHSSRHLTLVNDQRPQVSILRDQARGVHVTPSRGFGEYDSAMLLRGWLVLSNMAESIPAKAVGDTGIAEAALQQTLEVAGHDPAVLLLLLPPATDPIERNAGSPTANADLLSQIINLLGSKEGAAPRQDAEPLDEPLTDSEMRVLRLLPTHLSKREVADALYLSVNTVKAHTKRLYAKLDVHTRRAAVDRARQLGLL